MNTKTLSKLAEASGNGVMLEATERAEIRAELLTLRTHLEQAVRAIQRLPDAALTAELWGLSVDAGAVCGEPYPWEPVAQQWADDGRTPLGREERVL